MRNGIQDLQEHGLGRKVITHIAAALCNVQEEISLRAILHDNISAVGHIEDPEERDDVGVCRDLVVQLHLRLLEVLLPRIQGETIGIELVQDLYGILNSCADILGQVDYSIGS